MSSQIKITAGEIFSGNADSLLVSIDRLRYSTISVKEKLREHWRVEPEILDRIPVGDIVISPIRNSNRADNNNPANFLLFTDLGDQEKHRLPNLAILFPALAAFSRDNKTVREIAIQLDDSWADEDYLRYLFDCISVQFFPNAHPDCSIELYYHDAQQVPGMQEFLAEYLDYQKRQLKLTRAYHTQNAHEKLLTKRYYIIRGFANTGAILIDPAKSLLNDGGSREIMDAFQQVEPGSLIFRSVSVSSSMDFLPVSAIGEVKENLGGKLKIIWFLQGFSGQIKNRNYPLRSINEVTMDYEKRDMHELLKASFFSGFTENEGNSTTVPGPDLVNAFSNSILKNVEVSNDLEIGEDYLDIADDVDAFARIIALKDLRPPLAIALCGKWGSGKSFFMGKMSDKIHQLSGNESGLFCKGVAQIKFNAWSYLDSNLWAGLVTRIFNGINAYINKYIESDALREKIKQDLDEKVSLSHQSIFKTEAEKIKVSDRIKKLEKERDDLDERLKKDLNKLRTKSFTDFLTTAMDGFKVNEKITDALEKNKSVKEVSDYIQQHFPEELWADSRWIEKQRSWWTVFFKDLFSWKRLLINALVLTAIFLVFYFVPDLLTAFVNFLNNSWFSFTEHTWKWIACAGVVCTNAIKAYKKIQPLFAALWDIKKKYVEKVEDTRHRWVQESEALEVQIAIDNENLKTVEQNLENTQAELGRIEFRLLNRLNTEAFQTFLKDKTGESGYRKHQGIVATIRDDFETLSGLFENYSTEQQYHEEGKNDTPLERIVLYIDDLDRCDESRVLEVLEAVHLIMALNLFVVVVGIDPNRVKSALSRQLRSRGSRRDPRIASSYLEKIFQVPFHLNQPSDRAVKKMLNELLLPSQASSKTDAGAAGRGDEGPSDNRIAGDSSNAFPPPVAPVPVPEPLLEKLTLQPEEIVRIAAFSLLIGSNPRSVKRFVNILRIARAHVQSMENEGISGDLQSEILLLLLALSIGSHFPLYQKLTRYLKDSPPGNLSNFVDGINETPLLVLKKNLQDFLDFDQRGELSGTPLEAFAKVNTFIRRFSFEDMA